VKEIILNKLECFNDPELKFDPKLHKYTYFGENLTPVTKFIEQFHKPFDSDYWSKVKSEEYGISQEAILSDWKKINEYANEVGTDTHEWIECYFNKIWKPLPTNEDVICRINKFNKIYAKHLYKLEPLVNELRVFSKKWKIAGTIDALFLNRGKICIVDYKTNKDFTTDDTIIYKEKLLYPFNNYYKTHLNEYSIQISLYSLILEQWGFDVVGGYILHIGPGDLEAKLYKCVDMRKPLLEFLNGSL
jgi:ATP-dependent exoDNAse (exonuclease V) beta subunit